MSLWREISDVTVASVSANSDPSRFEFATFLNAYKAVTAEAIDKIITAAKANTSFPPNLDRLIRGTAFTTDRSSELTQIKAKDKLCKIGGLRFYKPNH